MKERFLIRLSTFAGISDMASALVCVSTGLAFSRWLVLAIWLLCAIYSFRLLGSAAGGAALGICKSVFMAILLKSWVALLLILFLAVAAVGVLIYLVLFAGLSEIVREGFAAIQEDRNKF